MMGFQSCTVAHCLVARRILINVAICNLCLICACRQPFTAVQEWIDCTRVMSVHLPSRLKSSAHRAGVDQSHKLLEDRRATRLSWSVHTQTSRIIIIIIIPEASGLDEVEGKSDDRRPIRLPGWDAKTKRRAERQEDCSHPHSSLSLSVNFASRSLGDRPTRVRPTVLCTEVKKLLLPKAVNGTCSVWIQQPVAAAERGERPGSEWLHCFSITSPAAIRPRVAFGG